MSNLLIPEQPPEGIVFTEPYLEIGQVLVTLVDNDIISDAQDLQPGMTVGVAENSYGEAAAGEIGVSDQALRNQYGSTVQVLQALIDEAIHVALIDSYTAAYFVDTYPDRLKIVGGDGRDAWVSSRAYGIALSEQDEELRQRLNEAITAVKSAGDVDRLTVAWLIPSDTLDPGEPRGGTPASEIVIGIVGQLPDMDPASPSDLIGWEIKSNTMSGLYGYDSENQLVPLLASDMLTFSEDKLTVTVGLRQGVQFPDGSELTAADVKWSVDRSRSLGNFLVNGFLKDSNEDGFADDDAVQIVDEYTVRFVLAEPTAQFANLLATPPYFPISSDCYGESWDYQNSCGGIGPYTIIDWQPDEFMSLRANPEWPGRPAPAFENILIRFQDDPSAMRRSIEEFQSIDIAWTGLPYDDYLALRNLDSTGDGAADFSAWTSPAAFKSYLMFNHEVEPWNSANVRQAAALALNREALAAAVFNGSRQPLLSPVPDAVPGHLPVLPAQDLDQARALLQAEGYSETNPLAVTLSFVNDGRYSAVEETYANAIKAQLEETDIFEVTLAGGPFDTFRVQIAECNTPFYLLGWPSPGRPVDYLDPAAWTEFFILSNSFCSNYDREEMTELYTAAQEELDSAARLALYGEIQTLWAEDLLTLDLLQEPRHAISLPNVNNVHIDALGLMHYELLTKGGG